MNVRVDELDGRDEVTISTSDGPDDWRPTVLAPDQKERV